MLVYCCLTYWFPTAGVTHHHKQWLKATQTDYLIVLEVKHLKIKVLSKLFPSGSSRGQCVSLCFPASRGHLHFLAHDFILHLQSCKYSIF